MHSDPPDLLGGPVGLVTVVSKILKKSLFNLSLLTSTHGMQNEETLQTVTEFCRTTYNIAQLFPILLSIHLVTNCPAGAIEKRFRKDVDLDSMTLGQGDCMSFISALQIQPLL